MLGQQHHHADDDSNASSAPCSDARLHVNSPCRMANASLAARVAIAEPGRIDRMGKFELLLALRRHRSRGARDIDLVVLDRGEQARRVVLAVAYFSSSWRASAPRLDADARPGAVRAFIANGGDVPTTGLIAAAGATNQHTRNQDESGGPGREAAGHIA